MKTLDLNAYGVEEMNQQEMASIDGGNIFKAIAEWVENAYNNVKGWINEHVSTDPNGNGFSIH